MTTNASPLNFTAMGRKDLEAPDQGSNQNQKRPAATIWLNIGTTVELPAEGGGTEEVFVNVFGVPVDNVEAPKPYTGKNERMRQISEVKTMLYQAMLNGGTELDPGVVVPVNGLDLELRKVGAAQAPTAADNDMLKQLSNRIKIG